jgi:hypothetical protein
VSQGALSELMVLWNVNFREASDSVEKIKVVMQENEDIGV